MGLLMLVIGSAETVLSVFVGAQSLAISGICLQAAGAMMMTLRRLVTWPWRERPNYARIAELEQALGMVSLDEQLEALTPAPFFATNPPQTHGCIRVHKLAEIVDIGSLSARHGPGYEQLERAYRR